MAKSFEVFYNRETIAERELKMKRFLSFTVAFIAATGVFAQDVKTFYVNDEAKRDVVTFTSKAPLETIVGTTGDVVGHIEVDLQDVKAATKGRFEVDLASLKTGIGLRDSHMREQYLETDKYPKTIFQLKRVVETDQNSLTHDTPVKMLVEGNFTVHGVTRTITVPLTISYIKESEETKPKLPGDLLHIVGTFDVLLSDYNIKRPQFVILKLDDKQVVNVDLFASTGSPPVEMME
jgi:polyisoprenoid-binding protein YceI